MSYLLYYHDSSYILFDFDMKWQESPVTYLTICLSYAILVQSHPQQHPHHGGPLHPSYQQAPQPSPRQSPMSSPPHSPNRGGPYPQVPSPGGPKSPSRAQPPQHPGAPVGSGGPEQQRLSHEEVWTALYWHIFSILIITKAQCPISYEQLHQMIMCMAEMGCKLMKGNQIWCPLFFTLSESLLKFFNLRLVML